MPGHRQRHEHPQPEAGASPPVGGPEAAVGCHGREPALGVHSLEIEPGEGLLAGLHVVADAPDVTSGETTEGQKPGNSHQTDGGGGPPGRHGRRKVAGPGP